MLASIRYKGLSDISSWIGQKIPFVQSGHGGDLPDKLLPSFPQFRLIICFSLEMIPVNIPNKLPNRISFMPYFVFTVKEDRTAELLAEFEVFAEAKSLCRERRQAIEPGVPVTVRMVFAKNKKEARGLLLSDRKPSTPIEEWEG
jgi:hypothetical protein